eukprot:9731206-Lingulodinium_polyedra.AAC.1
MPGMLPGQSICVCHSITPPSRSARCPSCVRYASTWCCVAREASRRNSRGPSMSPSTIMVGSSNVHLRIASSSISTARHRPARAVLREPEASH